MPANGSAELHEIAVKIKAQGAVGLKLRMMRGLRAGAQPLIPAVRASALRQLPKRGGLNTFEATQKIRVSVRTSARLAGIRIVGKASAATDTGTWRHPTPELMAYHRSYWAWVEQNYQPASGWWTNTMRYKSPAITPALMGVMREITAELEA